MSYLFICLFVSRALSHANMLKTTAENKHLYSRFLRMTPTYLNPRFLLLMSHL